MMKSQPLYQKLALECAVVQMDVSTVSNHVCAILDVGDVRCWGSNTYGQLGYAHMDNIGDDELPSSQPVLSVGENALSMASGNVHTCALFADQVCPLLGRKFIWTTWLWQYFDDW